MGSTLDIYCERGGEPGLWAEPVNALTNLAFLLAALLVARRLATTPDLRLHNAWDLWLLTLVLAAIGIGSGLWHTVATAWAVLADVIPIAVFINLYLLSFGWRVLRLRPVALLALWLGYQTVNAGLLALVPADALNGSAGYLPALAFLGGFAVVLHRRGNAMASQLMAAAGLFALSVVLCTLDKPLCGGLPLGTHFLWHLLNAVLLYLLLTGLIRYGRRPAANHQPPATSHQPPAVRHSFLQTVDRPWVQILRRYPCYSGKHENCQAP